MRRPTRVLAAAMVVAAGSILWLPSTEAQTPQPQSPNAQRLSPAQPQQPANIPDQKLDAAAAAMKQVAALRQDYQRKLNSAAPSDQERIAGEANDALQKAVTDQGLSVDEYSSILQVAQNDPDVRQKIIQRLNRANGQ